ncbi:hypothetical protein CYLTODRAFT_419974 [Cylindrobasidium torrendii FP15055 ss-10]|uniref:Uncharacterized protein n=1 Tax=Cylindrobasidium torrendii FP15055 ss-10 TaxID=1314674 RepID=A0A0D7BJH3_9AGAR|nr:hypothetical protein CYLTODRAFT_419974 [Cylindrobasidium torrendii FP15055 ss-10]
MKLRKQRSSYTSYSRFTDTPSITISTLTPATSQRWSAVVPPKSALAFAVLWDPDSDMVAFSGAHLDAFPDSDTELDLDVPSAGLYGPTYSTARSSALRWFQDNHQYLFSESSRVSQTGRDWLDMPGRVTQASSALLIPYWTPTPRTRYLSSLDKWDTHFSFDPRTEFAKAWPCLLAESGMPHDNEDSDSGRIDCFEEIEPSETERIRFVSSLEEVYEADEESTWSALPTPERTSPNGLSPRRLRKPRRQHPENPARASVVLHREGYNYMRACDKRKGSPLKRFMSKWGRAKKPWVCVQVTQEVAQTV